MTPPKPLLRFSQVRQLDTSADGADEDRFARGRYLTADCLATDEVGHFVYITGDEVATNVFQVTRVDVEDSSTMPALGVILEKSTPTRCIVMTWGIVPGTGLTAGARYWVGADAKISAAHPPRVPGELVVAQVAGIALSTTKLLIRPEYQAHILRF